MKSVFSKVTLHPFLIGVFFSLVDAKGTYYGNPYRYNLFKSGVSPHHSPGKPMGRHKNHCAYVVQKNISCTMQDGMATYVKAEYTKCVWGSKCPVVMYRTFYKPKYKVGYKTITELEWRCCPGYSGEGCFDGPTSLPDTPPFKGGLSGVKGYPRGHPRVQPEQRPIPGGHLDPTKSNYAHKFSGVTGERLDRIEDDVRRLSQGLDTLNGMVTGLEERLRQGMREDTNKILTTLIGTTPRTSDSSVGFGEIPDGTPDGLEGGEGFPGFGDLVGRVTEVKDEIRAKSDMLDEIHGMVLGHDGQLKQLLELAAGKPTLKDTQKLLEDLVDAKLAGIRAEILDGFERRLTGMQTHCDERIAEVQQQCHQDQLNGQQQMQSSLDGQETGLRKELGNLQAQIQGLTLTESCCTQVSNLAQRVLLLEDSVKGLTESQRQLQIALSDQTIHVETMIEGRLEDIEGRINATERTGIEDGGRRPLDSLDGWKTLLDEKLKTLEDRLFTAVEELSNVTAPTLLEGQAVPALETEIDAVRQRVESGLDGVQKQLTDLELLCTSSCSSTMDGQVDDGDKIEEEDVHCGTTEGKLNGRLNGHSDRLDKLNDTLGEILARLAQEEEEGGIQGEITLLKVNINSVNRTLKGLRESLRAYAREVGQVNATWQHREDTLASQVQGITQLVGRQVMQLGSSERRLIQLKGELQSLRHRLAGELQGCRSTALGVQREVMAVDSRVKQVEGQCSSLSDLAEHLERIRGELERYSESYLSQFNGTLASHSQQLTELKDGLKDCLVKTGQ
ncbi:hypothetical protein GJAV_G00190570 [Gymnothorax javanicus]|nr:hypothetical protein GJAV_G00190570 [Gymnothorax javanicus]